MTPLVLSLFPGIDILGKAFEEEGFCIVRGPDLIWGGNIRTFHVPAGKFDGIIGGPPCQMFSVMRYINPLAGQKHGNLIPEFERCVMEAQPDWFLMENVRDAPIPMVDGYQTKTQMVKDVWVGGVTMRYRRFSFGTRDGHTLDMEWLALHSPDPEVSALAGGGNRTVPVKLIRDGNGGHVVKKRYGNSGQNTALGRGGSSHSKLKSSLAMQGLPDNFLEDAPFTLAGKCHAVGNGVPLPMGRAIAKAVKRSLEAV